MRLVDRLLRREAPQEALCPRCRVPVPAEANTCAVCEWDLHEGYPGIENRTGSTRAAS